MDQTTTSGSPRTLFDEISHELAAVHHAEAGQMFGMPCLNINGKAFAGFYQDAMVFKLTGEDHRKALNLSDAKLFDPSNRQRPMKEWVQVTFAHAKEWHIFAEAALEYVQDSTKG